MVFYCFLKFNFYLKNIYLENEEISKILFPTVICQESENLSSMKYENNVPRDMSPTSELSQSTQRSNTPSNKDIYMLKNRKSASFA